MLGMCTVVVVEAGKVPDRQQGAGPRHQCAANITGPTTVVAGGTYSYQANASGVGGLITTTWTVTGNATITSTNVGQFVTVETGDVAGSYTLSIVVECLSQSQPFHTDTVTDSMSVFVPAPPVDPDPEPDVPCTGSLSGPASLEVGATGTVTFAITSGVLQTLNFYDAGDVSITAYLFGSVGVVGVAEGSGGIDAIFTCAGGNGGADSHTIAVYAVGDPEPVPTNTRRCLRRCLRTRRCPFPQVSLRTRRFRWRNQPRCPPKCRSRNRLACHPTRRRYPFRLSRSGTAICTTPPRGFIISRGRQYR